MKTWIKNAVRAPLRDLDDRKGLSFDQVDAEVRRQIRDAWRDIIQAAYESSGAFRRLSSAVGGRTRRGRSRD